MQVSPVKTYYPADNITLNAVPATSYVFLSWTGDVGGIADPSQPNVTFLMGYADRTITANFVLASSRYTLTATADGGGAVQLEPDQTDYQVLETVSVTAIPNPEYAFDHWTGDLSGTSHTATLRIDGNKLITAVFNPTLTILQNITGSGAVDVAPEQIDNGYAPGTVVTMTARPATGYIFAQWTGDTDGIPDPGQRTVSVAMNGGRTITAEFTGPIVFKVAATAGSEGMGSIIFDPAQPSDGYLLNQEILAYASPEAGYSFSHWTGDASGTASAITMRVDAEIKITAVFYPKVTIELDPREGGTVELLPVQSSKAYAPGTLITVTAVPNKGYRFSSWDSADLSGQEISATATVNAPMMIRAVFVKQSQSPFPVWLWPLIGIVGLLVVVVVVRLFYRMSNAGGGAQPS